MSLPSWAPLTERDHSLDCTCGGGLGGGVPAYKSVDFYNLSYFFLIEHNIYIDFKPVKRIFGTDSNNQETDQGFGFSKFKDTGCVGYMLICEPHETRKVMKLVKQYFPTRTRTSLDDYPRHIKLSVFLLDGSGRMNKTTLENIPNLFSTLQQDYDHSKSRPPIGGALTKKLLANVDGLHSPMVDNEGRTTSLRQFLMSRKDPVTLKPRFGAICPTPTAGNKGSCHTQSTTYRSGSAARSGQMADRGSQYAAQEMCNEIWSNFPAEELDKVLAPSILDDLAMDTAVVLEDLPNDEADNKFLEDEAEAVDLRSMDSRLAPSISSEITGLTAKTTQSTKDKLSEAHDELKKLRNELARGS